LAIYKANTGINYTNSFKIEPYRKNLFPLDFLSSESVELLYLLNLLLYKVSTDLLYFSYLTTGFFSCACL